MKKKLLLLLPIAGLLGYSFLSEGNSITKYHASAGIDGVDGITNASNPPAGRTGAPGEGNCTGCHSGSTMSAEGVVSFTLSGGPTYTPGATYPMTVSLVSGDKNGFQLTVLDSDGNQAGTFTAGAGSSVTSSADREYIRQSDPTVTSWTFDWTAPAEAAGELTAYYAVNVANNNGSTSGDEIFLGDVNFPLEGASIEENSIDASYEVYFNSSARELNLNYALEEEAQIVLNIQDLSGKLIQFYDFDRQQPGQYSEVLPVENIDKSGVYVVSLFVNNRVFNRKLMFN